MKVALIGATGNVGSRLLTELIDRGHQVTAISRHPEQHAPQEGVTAVKGDINDSDNLSSQIAGHDAVISSVRFDATDPNSLIAALKRSGVDRLLVVGGAGSLEVAPGVQLVDTPEFPDEYKSEAIPGRDFLNLLRSEKELNWTFLCPSGEFGPGERTGKFRLGTDRLLVGPDGKSRISMEDYAMAMVDELETPAHSRRRFTVGY